MKYLSRYACLALFGANYTQDVTHNDIPEDNKATNCACLRPFVPQIFKDFRYVISSKLTRDRSKAIKAPLNTLL